MIKTDSFKATEKMGLGTLRDPKVHVLAGDNGLAAISDEVRDFLTRPELLIVTKTKARSRVHRIVNMDYIGVKRYGKGGQVIGEMRFVGLFTATAYNCTVDTIPLLRSKVAHTIRLAGFAPESHDAKALLYVLDSFPRDELFQVSDDYLLHTALGILDLRQRPRIRAFPRLDRFKRFASVLVYIPRELHTTALRERLGGIVANDEGSFTTLPLAIRGNRLRLNLRVKSGGEVRVEAADAGGEPLPGRTFADADGLTGDALDRQVTWNGAADIAPDAVMLRFRLRGAKLFAFEFV